MPERKINLRFSFFHLTQYSLLLVCYKNYTPQTQHECCMNSLHDQIPKHFLFTTAETKQRSINISMLFIVTFNLQNAIYWINYWDSHLAHRKWLWCSFSDWAQIKTYHSCGYRKTSSISRTKSQNLNVSCILLQLSSLNPLKPGVKLRMKM